MTTYNTGNPIGSTDARDRLDNTENMDYLENSRTKLTHPDRLGAVRKTRHGMEVEHDNQISAHKVEHDNQIAVHETEHDAQMQSFENDFDGRLAGMAFTRVGSFASGATLTDMRQVLVWEASQGGDGHEYGWAGTFPKVVAAGATPATSGGIGTGAWVDRTDVTLMGELSASDGRSLIGAYASVAEARLAVGLIGGSRVDVVGYYSTMPLVGGGTFYADASDTTTLDDGGMVLVTADGMRLKRWLGFSERAGMINAEWFGCVGDRTTDNTTMSQAALTYCTLNGFDLSYPEGWFYHSGQVTKPQSFTAPNIYGVGANNTDGRRTVLQFDSAIGLKIKGGSGSLCRSAIYNCVLRGKSDQTTIPLQFADIGGYDAVKCLFESAAFAAEFYNESPNAFTEFCRLVDCEITTSCLQALNYKRGSGNDSFHGSGIDGNSLINEPSDSVLPQIVIGENCLPYNAPMNFTIFKRSSQSVIQNNAGHSKTNFYGKIKIETSTHYTPALATGSNVAYLGELVCFTQGVTLGKLTFVERLAVNSDGSITMKPKSRSFKQTITSGDVLSGAYPDNNDSFLVAVSLYASNYEYNYLLVVYRNITDNAGSVTTLATMREFNVTGYGAPTFSFTSDSGLTVTNANYPASTVVAEYTITPLAMRSIYPLL